MRDPVIDEAPLRFVELETLHQTFEGYYEWKEKARWIKLEEDLEEGSGRWSKPYIPKLSYKTLHDLRITLNNGDILLDVEDDTLDGIATKICESLTTNDVISEDFVRILHATILARHHHHNQKKECDRFIHSETMPSIITSNVIEPRKCSGITLRFLEDDHSHSHDSHTSDIAKYMTTGSEATTILVANVPYAKQSVVLFVRLKESTTLGNLTEISLPVRFLFLVLGTENCDFDCFQIGRALGTLISDDTFGNLAATCQTKSDLINGIEDYLLNSSILPSGNWGSDVWNQSLSKWIDSQPTDNQRKSITNKTYSSVIIAATTNDVKGDETVDPFQRTGTLFGGLIKDIKRKIPFFASDFTDALNARCLISIIFIYFSFLAPAITFGAIMSNSTFGYLGVSEMILSTSVCGVIFGLFAGQPLIILGATGPLLIMEESIYQLSTLVGVEYLPWRAWIGFWICLFCLLVVAFDLSFLVRYFTLFTEEVMAALISTVFIYESFRHVVNMITQYYLPTVESNMNNSSASNITQTQSQNQTHDGVALMTIILMFGTFLLCHYILKLRHSKYFPRQLRNLLSDFGILLSVLLFLLFDVLMKDDYTPKLDLPDDFTPTSPSKRGWMVNILADDITAGPIIFASVPAFLVTIILFMETELTGTIVDRKEHKLVKGSGYNLDMFIVGILVSMCSFFGLPWMCACPVHSIAHLNSLSILSTNNAPGTRAQVVRVIEQRVTNILMHLLIGVSVFLASILRAIPIAVLLGVFLYLGVTSVSHLQLTERIKLLFIPSHHHPDSRYIRKLKTRKIHLFTCIQIVCLVILLIIKNTILGPSFPFFVILMIPLRKVLHRCFTEEELDELDNLVEETFDSDLDEYDLVHVPM